MRAPRQPGASASSQRGKVAGGGVATAAARAKLRRGAGRTVIGSTYSGPSRPASVAGMARREPAAVLPVEGLRGLGLGARPQREEEAQLPSQRQRGRLAARREVARQEELEARLAYSCGRNLDRIHRATRARAGAARRCACEGEVPPQLVAQLLVAFHLLLKVERDGQQRALQRRRRPLLRRPSGLEADAAAHHLSGGARAGAADKRDRRERRPLEPDLEEALVGRLRGRMPV
eukprot:CAMPEP_0185425322 /NCGR_PEP_ID=MMETSP1365-20130426/13868_1 /TAXON_ID=38817 /ORGANISM="Gephyrocapsa oceanica, Strain RCC1303" /LENGTH=232 /DNA_ID=CAMNT_0028029303 /DNA_START=298 /DNA_END=992 /DNA_ORIENTATION=+